MRRRLGIFAATIGGALAGCAAPPPPPETTPLRVTHSPPPSADRPPAAEAHPPLDPAIQADIDQLIADLESLGPVNETAKRELAAELAATQPALRKALIQQHRALIAYRKQQAARAEGSEPATDAIPTPHSPGATAVSAERSLGDDSHAEAVYESTSIPGVTAVSAAHAPALLPHDESAAQDPQSRARRQAAADVPFEQSLGPPAGGTTGLQFPASARGAVVAREADDSALATDFAAPATAPSEEAAAAEADLAVADAADAEPVAQDPAAETAVAAAPAETEAGDAHPAASPSIDDAQVTPASHVAIDPIEDADHDWQSHLAGAIAALEDDLASYPAAEGDDRPARLRLLYALAGRREDALRPASGLPADEQEFWSQELFGLATWLDEQSIGDPRRRATEAARHLRDAATTLGTLGNLQIRNVMFCTEVKGFGVCTPFERNEFKPREQVILYWEVENLKIEPTPKGHRTALRARYQIFDAQGANVDQGDFPVTEEYCQNRRRDYFVRYYLWLPERLYDGRHTLKLTVEDALNGNVGQGTLEFAARAR